MQRRREEYVCESRDAAANHCLKVIGVSLSEVVVALHAGVRRQCDWRLSSFIEQVIPKPKLDCLAQTRLTNW